MEFIYNDDDKIDALVFTEGETEASVVSEVQKYVRTVEKLGEEVEATVVPECFLKNQVWTLKQLL